MNRAGLRIVLRKGGLYLQPSGEWTYGRETALGFETSCAAVMYAFEHNLRPVEILFAFDDPAYDFVPVRL